MLGGRQSFCPKDTAAGHWLALGCQFLHQIRQKHSDFRIKFGRQIFCPKDTAAAHWLAFGCQFLHQIWRKQI